MAETPEAPARRTQEFFLGEGTFPQPEATENLLVNIGPSHPAMHGVIRIFTELDGERVVKADVEIGYLHRGFEKHCEAGPYNNAMPYTDRLNYVSPLINNFGYCSAVEKLLGIDVTERCQYVRVIMSEISRITDHLTCIGATAMELGAFRETRGIVEEVHKLLTGNRIFVDRMKGVGALSKEETISYAITGPMLRA